MTEIVAKLGAGRTDAGATDLELLQQAFGPTRFVHLWGEDTFARAVSWVWAEQTGYWQNGNTVLPGHEPHDNSQQIAAVIAPSPSTTRRGGTGSQPST